MPDFVLFFGRFHTVVLHFPIALLLVGFLMEMLSRKEKYVGFKQAAGFLLTLGAIAAVVNATFGLILQLEGGYEGRTLDWHKWLGIGIAVASVLLVLMRNRGSSAALFTGLFAATAVAIVVTGHLGGSLTHGSDYLTYYLTGGDDEDEQMADLSDPSKVQVFHDLINPILEDNCQTCHRPGKSKGGLLMTTIAGLKQGGDAGPVIIEGDPGASELVHRVTLPTEDEDHMPPDGRRPLSRDQIKLLTWWIGENAPFDGSLAEVNVSSEIQEVLDRMQPDPLLALAEEIDPPNPKDIESLKNLGIGASLIAMGSPFLDIRMPYDTSLTASRLGELSDVSEQVLNVDLGNSNVTDDMLAEIGKLPHLRRLNLRNTGITNDGLRHLRDAQHLEYLNLFGTRVDNAGLDELSEITSLKSLFLWQTDVTPDAAAKLKEQLPGLYINMGAKLDSVFTAIPLPAPQIEPGQAVFEDNVSVLVEAPFKGITIRYTQDGSVPDSSAAVYGGAVEQSGSGMFRARAYGDNWLPGQEAYARLVKRGRAVESAQLSKPAAERYNGLDGSALSDGKLGGADLGDDQWLGYEGDNVEATLDLGQVEEINEVTVGWLESTDRYVFRPKAINVAVSQTGRGFTSVGSESLAQVEEESGPVTGLSTVRFSSRAARFVRIEVAGAGRVPGWHPGSGRPAWVFVDEIAVN